MLRPRAPFDASVTRDHLAVQPARRRATSRGASAARSREQRAGLVDGVLALPGARRCARCGPRRRSVACKEPQQPELELVVARLEAEREVDACGGPAGVLEHRAEPVLGDTGPPRARRRRSVSSHRQRRPIDRAPRARSSPRAPPFMSARAAAVDAPVAPGAPGSPCCSGTVSRWPASATAGRAPVTSRTTTALPMRWPRKRRRRVTASQIAALLADRGLRI